MVTNKLLTLAFVREQGKVLLGYKKTGFGNGRWNGFGGKVEKGETIKEGAIRELHEESGLMVESEDIHETGVLMFEFVDDPQLMEVHVFCTQKYTGTPTESNEMIPKWYEESEIPYSKMWPDDEWWIPKMLKGDKFYGYFLFKGMNDILKYSLDNVNSLDEINIPAKPLYGSGDA